MGRRRENWGFDELDIEDVFVFWTIEYADPWDRRHALVKAWPLSFDATSLTPKIGVFCGA
jgi:hypothetical protein